MPLHRGKLLIIGITLLTLAAHAQNGNGSDRLSLPSQKSRYSADNKNYSFERQLVDESSELPPVYYDVRGAVLRATHSHSYMVENHAMVPLLRAEDLDGLLFIYEHRDYTPFTRQNGGSQVESVTNFDNLRVDYKVDDDFALKGIGGYANKMNVDKMGATAGYRGGIGIGTPYEGNMEDLRWEVIVGGMTKSENLDANWFADAEVFWRFLPLDIGTNNPEFKPSLALELSEQSTNDGARLHYYVEVGPTLEVLSVNNNRFSFYVHAFKNSFNEFQMISDRGVMAGIKATTFHDLPAPNSYVWDFEGVRWIPRMWGEAEVGGSPDGFMRKMRFYLDAWDINLAGQVVSIYGDYEHRQDQIGELSNTEFSIDAGVKTYVETDGWFSVITDGQHLVPFGQFFHRSDHAMNIEDPNRLHRTVTSNGFLHRESIDNLEAGFQTMGWNNPNYRIEKFQDDTKFVNEWDWMIKAGYALSHERERSQPPGSVGVNWDIFSLHGFVVYLQGIASTGEASPDYLAELGVKRPGGSLFIRVENYGLPARLEDDQKPIYAGFGLNL